MTFLKYNRSLYSDRQPIPDVPAIYFVEPTAQNIAKISEVIIMKFNIHEILYMFY